MNDAVLRLTLVAIAAVTLATGAAQLVAGSVLLGLIAQAPTPLAVHLFQTVGMFMAITGAMFLRALLTRSREGAVPFWIMVQKFAASLLVGWAWLKGDFVALSLFVAGFDALTGLLVFLFWREAQGMIGMLANLFLIGYALTCLFAGTAGLVAANWEMQQVLGLAAGAIAPGAVATLIGQYRFLKALEIAFGAFLLLYRRDILDGVQPFLIFLLGCGLGLAARIIGWWVDGRPSAFFLAMLVAEAATLVLVLGYSRRDRGSP